MSCYLWFGLGQGVVVMAVALLCVPQAGEIVASDRPSCKQGTRDYPPAALRSPRVLADVRDVSSWWKRGLMATAQLAPVAKDRDRHRAGIDVRTHMPALSFALSIGLVLTACRDRSSAGCPIGSDVRTRCSSLSRWKASASMRCFLFASSPTAFVLLSGVSTLPGPDLRAVPAPAPTSMAEVRDRQLRDALYGQGTAALGPDGQRADRGDRSWTAVFVVASAAQLIAATLALVALKPAGGVRWRKERLMPPEPGHPEQVRARLTIDHVSHAAAMPLAFDRPLA